MTILFAALIFGLVILFLLLKSMKGRLGNELKGTKSQKIRGLLKMILLIVDIVYILLFAAVIVKTMFMW